MILNILGSIFIGVGIFVIWFILRLKYLIKRTDKIVKENFKAEELTTAEKYTKPLIAIAGERVYTLRPLRHWQISKMMQLILLNKDAVTLDEMIKQESFYPALTYLFLRPGEDIVVLMEYLKKTITYKQILRILQIVLLQNDIETFKQIYKELNSV